MEIQEEQVGMILDRQKKYLRDSGEWGMAERARCLEHLEKVIMARRDDILGALGDDLGKPEVEAYVSEYYFLLKEIRMIRRSFRRWLEARKVSSAFYSMPARSEVRREAYGQVLIFSPWNYPFQLALSPLVAAVAAGNTVILKVSEMAPVSEVLLGEIVGECFLPEQVSLVTGDEGVAERLLAEAFDFIFFTGSTRVGRIVAQRAAERLTPAILELGGKCPCVVDASADIPLVARRILAGKFFNAGQTCFAPDYVVVHETVKAELVSEFKKVLDEVPWGDEMARVVNLAHFFRLRGLLEGAEIRQGDDDEGRLRFAPRILPDAGWGDLVMEEEIFGPILPVLSYASEGDLVRRLRSYGSPLALYLCTRSAEFEKMVLGSVRSGGVCINDTMKQGAQLNLPFGGVGESGYGRYRGKAGVHAFTYERAVVRRGGWGDSWFELLPPFKRRIALLKRLLR